MEGPRALVIRRRIFESPFRLIVDKGGKHAYLASQDWGVEFGALE